MGGQDRAGDGDAQGRAGLAGRGAETGAEARLVGRQGDDDAEGQGRHGQSGAGRDDEQPDDVQPVGRARVGGLPLATFEVPLRLPTLRLGMAWHPHHDAAPAHAWLRSCVRDLVTRRPTRDINP